MVLFDSHTHLCDPAFADDWEAALERARSAGVANLVDVGYDRATIDRSQAIAEQAVGVYTAAGFHPHEAGHVGNADISWLREKLRHPSCVALGEIGLDFVKNYADRDSQYGLLDKMLELAKQVAKPVIFHSRGAEIEVLEKAQSAGIGRAVFHCYTGPENAARRIIEAGYYLSFAGYVTFPKGWPNWIGRISLNRILIETDAPYLAPVPRRGKRNEPAFVEFTCKRLAEGLGMAPQELAEITSENARRFFGLTA